MDDIPVGVEVGALSSPLLHLMNTRATIGKSFGEVVGPRASSASMRSTLFKCPKCKGQMRIIACIQDEHSIKDIMKSQGISDFQAPPPIPKFIDTTEAIDELPSYDHFEPAPDEF
jgi:hypothetical protein